MNPYEGLSLRRWMRAAARGRLLARTKRVVVWRLWLRLAGKLERWL